MGGGFGGKESNASAWAAYAALAARVTKRPCKIRPDRDVDMAMTGKRHDFRADYDVGFDATGRIVGLDLTLVARCGYSDYAVVDEVFAMTRPKVQLPKQHAAE